MTLPPLALSVIARDPSGAETIWWSGDRTPGNRPQGLRFSTKRGEGFSEATVTLARRIDQDYFDLGLLNDIVIVGDEGSIAWEGRIAGRGASIDTGSHTISPSLVGWMSHARQRRFQEIYVDRSFAGWGGASRAAKIAEVAGNFQAPADPSVDQDATNGVAALVTQPDSPPWSSVGRGQCQAMYDASGVDVGSVYYAWTKGANVDNSDGNWHWDVRLSATDTNTDDLTSNLSAAGPSAGTLAATGTPRKFAKIVQYYGGTKAADQNTSYPIYWTCLAVFGTHGLTKRGTADATNAQGFYLSDMVVDIAQRWCPKLSTAGVQSNTYIVGQAAFKDRTFPYDAWQQLNNFALWELAVWEDRTLTFGPADFTDYDWQVRTTDPGVQVTLAGDTIDQLYNGVTVTYQDVTTGRTEVLTPDTNSELADADPGNPLNEWGDQNWAEFDLPFPATPGDALQFGIVRLAEVLRPSGAGTIAITGHVRDRAGHWQPAWKVRAGDTIAIVDHPNDSPRLVTETNYEDDSRTITIAVDSTFQELTAVLERIQAGIGAANLGGG